jgi:hypothetical protein
MSTHVLTLNEAKPHHRLVCMARAAGVRARRRQVRAANIRPARAATREEGFAAISWEVSRLAARV